MTADNGDAVRAVDDWIKRLEQAMPENGALTEQVLAEAGQLPVVIKPARLEQGLSERDAMFRRAADRGFAEGFAKSYAKSQAQFRSDEAWIQYGSLQDQDGDKTDSSRALAQGTYWGKVADWVDSL
ncbi:hypothetical protein QMY03_09610 [Arthrobacter sp. KFRI-F3372]|nr:hypothetical protein QMY03_09610 [Arthrobacter sp. KFRI-F3372]